MAKTVNFEHALQSLETIVKQLEQGDLSLDGALKQFEAGIGLTRVCQTLLVSAEQKIAQLTANTDE
jgi:exodeoxyribonuclease VII small subunit